MIQTLLFSVILGQATPIYNPVRIKEVILERAHLLGNRLSEDDALLLTSSVIDNHHLVPIPLTLAVIEIESRYVRKAKSSKACKGYMQLADGTAKSIAKRVDLKNHNPYNPTHNILLGTALLKILIDEQKGNRAKALTIYNAGWGGYVSRGKRVSGYAKAVLTRAKKLAHLLGLDLFCGKPLTTSS